MVNLIQAWKRFLWKLTDQKSSIVEVVVFLHPVFLLSTFTITCCCIITQAFTTTNPLPLVFKSFKTHLFPLLIHLIFTVAYDHAEWSKPRSQTRVVASSVPPFLTRACHIFILEFSCYFTRGPFLLTHYKLAL